MGIVRFSAEELEKNPGTFDRENGSLHEDLERFIEEDGGDWFDGTGPVRVYTPPGYVRAVRRRSGLTQSEFAHRFRLDEAMLAKWESGAIEPDCAAKTLLMVIDADPEAVAGVVRAFREGPPD